MKKSELQQIIREEIQNVLNEGYLKTKQLKPGMFVMHRDWDSRTSEPMKVVKVKGQLMLNDPEMGNTELTAGGESDDGWIVERWKPTERYPKPQDLEYLGEKGRGVYIVRFWKHKKTGEYYYDPHPKIDEIPGDTLLNVTTNSVPKNLREQDLNEGLIDRVFNHLRRSVEDANKRKEVEKINSRVAQQMDKLASVEDDLRKMLNKELSDAELEELLKKLS